MKKKIILNNIETNYEIYDDGRCFNVKTNKFLKGNIKNNGYKMYNLSINGEKKYYSVHRLVAMAFLENPEEKSYVNHKDGNKLNNNLSNLEWATPQENRNHAITSQLSATRSKQIKYFFDLPNEIWKKVNNTNYSVSNLGRVRNDINNNLLGETEQANNTYKIITLRVNGQSINYLLHRLVYYTFYPETNNNLIINHIDGNKKNNQLTNLEAVSSSENIVHSQQILGSKTVKHCFQYDLNNNLIKEYKTMTEAAEAIKGQVSGISQACSGKIKTYKSYIWKLKEV